jgi:hypothetical protein
MNTELIFAVTATLVVVVTFVLAFHFAPRTRELFIFDVLKATFGPERIPSRHLPPPKRRRSVLVRRVADGGKSVHSAERFDSAGTPAEAAR